jgi:hypothetical protein
MRGLLVDALTELRFPIDDPPPFDRGEIVAIASSLCTEPECWIRIKGRAIVNGCGKAANAHHDLRHLAAVEQARDARKELSVEHLSRT